MNISEALRLAMKDSGRSLYWMSKTSGVKYTAVHGFFHGKRDLQLRSAAKLAAALGLELRKPSGRSRRESV